MSANYCSNRTLALSDTLLPSTYSSVTSSSYKTAKKQSPQAQQKLEEVAGLLQSFILQNQHPCIIARSTLKGESCRFGWYPSLASPQATANLSRDLLKFLKERTRIQHPYASFIAVFDGPLKVDETLFEQKLWQQLQALHEHTAAEYPWDSSTSPHPEDQNFGFSFGGKAFYVVGMHANSSRQARQFKYPLLVFNLHEQFEAMRSKGTYEKVKKVIRKNDLKLQGSINPMLQDFGAGSEARQYSGRAVPAEWKCPFHS